jgi:hypothetical protein
MPEANAYLRLAVMGTERFVSSLKVASAMTRALTISVDKFVDRQKRLTLSKRAYRRWRGRRKATRRELRLRTRNVVISYRKFYSSQLGEPYAPGDR